MVSSSLLSTAYHLGIAVSFVLSSVAALPSTLSIRRTVDWPGLAARDDTPNCHTFDPDPQDTWDFTGYTSSLKVGESVDCTASSVSCPVNSTDVPDDLKLTWTIQWDTNVKGVGLDNLEFKANESLGTRWTNELTVYPGAGGNFQMSVPAGQRGYLSATARSVNVPGWFRNCGNGWDYGGRGLVPEANVIYNLVLHN